MINIAAEKQKDAMEADERLGMVEEYLNTPLPDNWDEMELYQRIAYLEGDPTTPLGKNQRKTVTNIEIWCECFKKDKASIKTADSYSISALMTQLSEWAKDPTPHRIAIYGKQRGYIRVK